jgi:hypothetical protein
VEAKRATIPTLTLLDGESNPDEPEEVDEAALPSFATPSSSQPTVSTLSTEEDEGDELPLLKSVFHCHYITTKIVNDGKDRWECVWCGKIFSPRHASRALRHVLKIKKADIAVCKAAIPDRYLARYQALYDSGKGRIDSKKRLSKSIGESVSSLQESAVGTLMKKRGIAVSDSAGHLSPVSPCEDIPTWNLYAVTQHLLTRRNVIFLNSLSGF